MSIVAQEQTDQGLGERVHSSDVYIYLGSIKGALWLMAVVACLIVTGGVLF